MPLILLSTVGIACSSWQKPDPIATKQPAVSKPPPPKLTEEQRLDQLAQSLGARPSPIENPAALDAFFRLLRSLEETKSSVVKVLQLGDSHIAADYITRTVRGRLQKRFGNAGRGFVTIDQRAHFGGRRRDRKGWRRLRIVDENGPGKAFGFSGMLIESRGRGARVEYNLDPSDARVVLYYQTHRRGGRLSLYLGDKRIKRIKTRSRRAKSKVETLTLSERAPETPLRLVADGRGVRVFGMSFEANGSGVQLHSVGPVGADAKVYLSLQRKSFRDHLQVLNPHLITLMVGGNDALMLRQKRRKMEAVRSQLQELIKQLKQDLPEADCMLWGPLDAGKKMEDGTITSKAKIAEVRDVQQQVAKELGCAFWDPYASMGGEGSFGRWLGAELMNEDLVHPRSKGADLLGHLFSMALMKAYEAWEPVSGEVSGSSPGDPQRQ